MRELLANAERITIIKSCSLHTKGTHLIGKNNVFIVKMSLGLWSHFFAFNVDPKGNRVAYPCSLGGWKASDIADPIIEIYTKIWEKHIRNKVPFNKYRIAAGPFSDSYWAFHNLFYIFMIA